MVWQGLHLVVPFRVEFSPLKYRGHIRGINSPMPIEIVQRLDRIVSQYEMNNTVHIVFTDGRDDPKDLAPTWFGHSIGKWEGDALMVDKVGFNDKTRNTTARRTIKTATKVTSNRGARNSGLLRCGGIRAVIAQ